jgi:hypothetical protein
MFLVSCQLGELLERLAKPTPVLQIAGALANSRT